MMDDYPNLAVLRTLSKFAGLAGMRVGYGIFPESLMPYLMRVMPGFCNVSAAASAAAIAALADGDYNRATIARIVADRESLADRLRRIPGVEPLPSATNFLLVRLPVAECGVSRPRAGESRRLRAPFRQSSIRHRGLPARLDRHPGGQRDLRRGTRGDSGDSGASGVTATEARAGQRRARIARSTLETQIDASVDLDGGPVTARYRRSVSRPHAGGARPPRQARHRGSLRWRRRDGSSPHGRRRRHRPWPGGPRSACDRRGIARYGHAYAPLDEALARVVIDCSGRPFLHYEAEMPEPVIGRDFAASLVEEFWRAFVVNAAHDAPTSI